jgi:CDP-glucose 4,6-dehydratase
MFDDFYRGKRVLITGHTGFKGSWLSEWLVSLGADIVGFSLGPPTNPCHFEVLRLAERLENVTGDVRSLESLKSAFDKFRPEIVLHLAAQPITRLSYEEPKVTFDTNLGGTVNVLEAVRTTSSVRVAVLVTSDKCYENLEWEYGYRESDRLGGKDPYSASKACAEIAFNAYRRSFFTEPKSPLVATVRAGNVIGGGDWAKDRIVPDCVRAWAAGTSPLIRYPQATRPWQHVLEPLSGYLWLTARMPHQREQLAGESFNFGPSPDIEHSVLDLINEIRKTWPEGAWRQDSFLDTRKQEASLLRLNCDKALYRLSWRPTLTFQEAARLTAEWYRTFYRSTAEAASCTSEQIHQFENLARKCGQPWAQ